MTWGFRWEGESVAVQRNLSFLVAWLIVAAVATTVAWQGVGLVGEQVTSERPAPLDAVEVRERLADEAVEVGAATTSSTEPSSETTSTTAGTADSVPEPPPTPPSDVPASNGPTGQSPAPESSAPAPTPQPTAPPQAPASATRTYNLVGGTASLRFTPSGVTVDYATPKAGFTVEIEPENGNGVKVEFRSDDHRSRVDGWWDGGPRERIREEAD